MIRQIAILSALALTGCMAGNPARPVLTCSGECTYYGPQQPDPRVEMARVLTGGLSSVAGIVVGGDVLKSLGSASGAASTIERTTNNTDRSSVTDRDHGTTVRESTSVSDRSAVSNTDSSITNNTSVTNTSTTGTAP